MPEHLIFDFVAALRTEPLPAGPPGSAAPREPAAGRQRTAHRPPVRTSRANGPPSRSATGPPRPAPRTARATQRPADPAVRPRRPGSRRTGWVPATVRRRRRTLRFAPEPDPGDRRRRGAGRRRDRHRVLAGQAGHHGHSAARRTGQRAARIGDGRAQLGAAEHPVRHRVTVPVTLDEWRFDGARRTAGGTAARSEPDRRADAHR